MCRGFFHDSAEMDLSKHDAAWPSSGLALVYRRGEMP